MAAGAGAKTGSSRNGMTAAGDGMRFVRNDGAAVAGKFRLNQLYNTDCMKAMQEIPDKFFELAICDPPYGIGIDGQKLNIRKNPKHSRKEHVKKNWDAGIPQEQYFRELERISVNQIIWGGNYFVEHLNRGTKGWIVWDKGQHGLTMSDCELAYTSFDTPTRIVVINRVELLKDGTFHPTQKPVKLYEWVISNYAKAGDKIIDTHAGSGSCLVAAHRTRHEFLGFEIEGKLFHTGRSAHPSRTGTNEHL